MRGDASASICRVEPPRAVQVEALHQVHAEPRTVSNSSTRSTPSAITIAPWSLANRTIVSTRFCLMKFVSMQLISDMSSLMKSGSRFAIEPSPA
jgi:hypothetical protein